MKRLYLMILGLVLISSWALADGIGFKGDRMQGYTTTVITLTKEQAALPDAKPKKKEDESLLRSISLTPQQRVALQKEAGFAPEKMEVWPLSAAKETCTCELLNMGIRFKPGQLEVPHLFLGKDLDDRLKSKKDRAKEKDNRIRARP